MAMHKKLTLTTAVLSMLLFSTAAAVQPVTSEEPNALPNAFLIAMPEEYLNYTITNINGSLWAKIDGTYPLHISSSLDQLSMLYPTPPGTTNISVKIGETELSWSNLTEIHPDARHFTALGDWPIINCTISPVPEYFTLKIHYEHPVMLINGSHTFLYDLNISPYLSDWSNKSTAYFAIRMEVDYTSLQVNTIATDGTLTPIAYTTTMEDTAKTVTFQIVSEQAKPLLGDILVTFTTTANFSYLLLIPPIVVVAVLIAGIIYRRKRAVAQIGE